MGIRLRTLWRVPVFCAAAGWVCWYLTIGLGSRFFVVEAPGADGVPVVSVDPVRTAIWSAALFLAVLLLGGLLAFRTMTRTEIAASAGIFSALCLVLTLAELCLSGFPAELGFRLAPFREWITQLASILGQLTGWYTVSTLLAPLAPLLFIPFGRARHD